MFVLLNFNDSKDNRACEHVGKMWADRQEGSSVSQTGELDSSDRKKSDKTEWGHAGLTKTGRLKRTHTTLQQSAKTLVYSVCVCWQRQTVMLLPAAQPLEGRRQTLHSIYSNAARHKKALYTATPLLVPA